MTSSMHIVDEPSVLNTEYWSYKGEGNANLILSYDGPDSLYENTILRLRKTEKEQEKPTPLNEGYIENLEYIDKAIGPLIGQKYAGKMILCKLRPDFLDALSRKIEGSRPESRRFKTIDVTESVGLICSDHSKVASTLFPPEHVLSIEIKPKWGFLPNSPHISQTNRVKRKVCRYCMHQYLKQKKDPAITRSHFCPLDLYSEDEPRVMKSLRCLLEVPQNNLKIHLNNRRLLFEQDEDFLSMEASLGIAPTNDDSGLRKERVIDLLTKAVSKALLHDGIMRKLKKLQSTLDEADIEGIFPIYKSLSEEEQYELRVSPLEWEATVKRYMYRMNGKIKLHDLQSLSKEEKFQKIREFMISTTLKDCSVMLTLMSSKFMPAEKRHLTDGVFSSFEIGDDQFFQKVGLVDLDPKAVSKIPHYYKLDQEIVAHYCELGVNEPCTP
ncbi:DUF941-domain-containing protein [Basidiobolus meristosporus CBS 931.73]|uniref:Inositol-pentakisphosphate 2-kinase n=1 Tax=Basidiobolus meristosporus CBS 931.73 TaxID=1314790 RepID=A0A1Y1XU85_9FUNG|nr:DUF941-domain-containing protein [Basidiobolus meristosporus CBS 931.73]|eukprot:ORX89322.1 DUF941-domain-containing protein [Basidiobolus meristosporus CBS 931.73]